MRARPAEVTFGMGISSTMWLEVSPDGSRKRSAKKGEWAARRAREVVCLTPSEVTRTIVSVAIRVEVSEDADDTDPLSVESGEVEVWDVGEWLTRGVACF